MRGILKHIRQIIFVFLLTLAGTSETNTVLAQAGEWTWMGGTQDTPDPGNYGAKGVSDPNNWPPQRYAASYWKDIKGNLWVFGGFATWNLSDLWKYDINTEEWTWMNGPQYDDDMDGEYGVQGIPSPLNYPPSLSFHSNCWTDKNGDLWLYGGRKVSGFAYYGGVELWKYTVATNEWTWVHGDKDVDAVANYGQKGVSDPNNTPGGRMECKSSWYYNKKLWFFGGSQSYEFAKADLWSFDLDTYEWTWESGVTDNNFVGSYGTIGVADQNNSPPGKMSYTQWIHEDKFYLFAGARRKDLTLAHYNDLWVYDPATKLWTWQNGSEQLNDNGQYGSICEESKTFTPQSRLESPTAKGHFNNICNQFLWSFGGMEFQGFKLFNDLWVYDIEKKDWTLVKGYPYPNNSYLYGTKGVSAPFNNPPSKSGACMWQDNQGALWIFGGSTNISSGGTNDLWKFEPDYSCIGNEIIPISFDVLSDQDFCPGDTVCIEIPACIDYEVSPNDFFFFDEKNLQLCFVPLENTNFEVQLSSPFKQDYCFNEDGYSFTMTKPDSPEASFYVLPSDSLNIDEGGFSFINTSTNAIKYYWVKNEVIVSNETDHYVEYDDAGEFCWWLIAENSCEERDSVLHCVYVIDPTIPPIDTVATELEVLVPNAFSPNGDGVNDLFHPIYNTSPEKIEWSVFDRWGNEVFTTTNINESWDGSYQSKACELGVYVFWIKVQGFNSEEIMQKGNVSLVR